MATAKRTAPVPAAVPAPVPVAVPAPVPAAVPAAVPAPVPAAVPAAVPAPVPTADPVGDALDRASQASQDAAAALQSLLIASATNDAIGIDCAIVRVNSAESIIETMEQSMGGLVAKVQPNDQRIGKILTCMESVRSVIAQAREIGELTSLFDAVTGDGTPPIVWPTVLTAMADAGGVELESRYPSTPNGRKLRIPAFVGSPANKGDLNRGFCTSKVNKHGAQIRNCIIGKEATGLNDAETKAVFFAAFKIAKAAEDGTRPPLLCRSLQGLVDGMAKVAGRYTLLRCQDGILSINFVRDFHGETEA